jgi:hypothetical protein
MRSIPLTKAQVLAAIDEAAERERLKYITPGSGQALVYEAKKAEVARWNSSNDSEASFPWAKGRADRLKVPVLEVIATWEAQARAWAAVGISIENVREAAKEAVTAAKDDEAAMAVLDVIEWPQP